MSDKKTANNTVILERLRKLIDGEKSRQVIADKIGCNVSLITKHYNGNKIVTIDFLKKYAEYFGVSADYLLGLTNAATTDKDLQAVCDFTGLSDKTITFFSENIGENSVKYNTPNKALINLIQFSICNFSNGYSLADYIYCYEDTTNQIKELIEKHSLKNDIEHFKDEKARFRHYRSRLFKLQDKRYELEYRIANLCQMLLNDFASYRCGISNDVMYKALEKMEKEAGIKKIPREAFKVPLADSEIKFMIAGKENE